MRTGPQGPLLPCRLQQVGSTAWGASTNPSPPTATEPGDHGNLRPQDKTGGKRMGRSFVKMAKPCQPLQNCQINSNLMKKQSNYSSVQWEGACHSTEHKWNFKEGKALTRGFWSPQHHPWDPRIHTDGKPPSRVFPTDLQQPAPLPGPPPAPASLALLSLPQSGVLRRWSEGPQQTASVWLWDQSNTSLTHVGKCSPFPQHLCQVGRISPLNRWENTEVESHRPRVVHM